MDILINPISGGWIISQIAQYIVLRHEGYQPTTVMGGSGGGILCGAISAVANDSSTTEINQIYDRLNIVSSKYFFRNKLPGMLTFLTGIVSSSVYDHGEEFPESLFRLTSNSPECIFTTFNVTTGKPAIFRHKGDNKKREIFDLEKNLEFAEKYEIKSQHMFEDAVRASFSIPGVLPAVKISGDEFLDSGVLTPSPFNYLSKNIPKKSKIVYNSPFNLYNTPSEIKNAMNVFFVMWGYMIDIMVGAMLTEVNIGINLIGRNAKCKEGSDLKEAMAVYNKCSRCFMLVHPENCVNINMLNFSGSDMVTAVSKLTESRMFYKIWYK